VCVCEFTAQTLGHCHGLNLNLNLNLSLRCLRRRRRRRLRLLSSSIGDFPFGGLSSVFRYKTSYQIICYLSSSAVLPLQFSTLLLFLFCSVLLYMLLFK